MNLANVYSNETTKEVRAAIYCRLSKDDDLNGESASIGNQRDLLFRYCEEHGFRVCGIYQDEGISGTNTKKREEFNRMIEDCMNGKVHRVITKSISRFARNTLDCLKYIRQLKDINVPVYFEKENIDSMDSKGEVLLTIMASLAQQESQSLSQNVKLGIQFRYQKGEVQVNHNRFLGYTKDENKKLVIDSTEAEIVRRIYYEYLQGDSLIQIARKLEKDGILTAAGKSKWRPETLKKILQNEKYIGDALLQKTYTVDFLSKKRVKNDGSVQQYYVEDNHEAIIPKELFMRMQEEMKRRANISEVTNGKRRVYSSKYALSSIVFCGHCNDMYRRTHWNIHGRKQIVWRCVTRLNTPGVECQARTLTEVQLQNLVLEAINKVLGGKGRAINVLKTNISSVVANTHVDEIKRLEKALEKQQKLLVKMTGGGEDYSKVVDKIYSLKEQLDEANSQNILHDTQTDRVKEMIEYLDNQVDRVIEYDEQLVRKLIDKIIVYDKKLEFLFKSGVKIEINA